MHPSGATHEVAVTSSTAGIWEATTPHEKVPTPSAARPLPEARSPICWMHGSEPPAIIEAATPLAVPASPLTESPPPRLKRATPSSASILEPAPATPGITSAAEARLKSVRMGQPITAAPHIIAIRRMPILISWRRAQHTPAASVAAEGSFPRPATLKLVPAGITQACWVMAADVHEPCANLPRGRGEGGGGGAKNHACPREKLPAAHENRLAAALAHHGQSPFPGSFAVSLWNFVDTSQGSDRTNTENCCSVCVHVLMVQHRTRLPRATTSQHSGRSDAQPVKDAPPLERDAPPASESAALGSAGAQQIMSTIQELSVLDVHGLWRVGASADALPYDYTFE